RGRRTGARLRRSRNARLGAGAGVIVAVAFAVGVWVAVPLWVGGKLAGWAEQEAGRTADVSRITVNPFTLAVALERVVLSGPAVRVEADKVVLNFAARALLGRTLALDALEIAGPTLQLDLELPQESAARERAESLASMLPRAPLRIARAGVVRGRVEWLDPRGENAPVALG